MRNQGAGDLSALLILVKGQDIRRIANFWGKRDNERLNVERELKILLG